MARTITTSLRWLKAARVRQIDTEPLTAGNTICFADLLIWGIVIMSAWPVAVCFVLFENMGYEYRWPMELF